MSPIPVSFSQDDMNRGKIVTPGWYKLQIGEFAVSLTKAGDSEIAVAEGTRILCAENGDEEFAGVPIRLGFSLKPNARGFMLGFLQALGNDVAPGKNFDLGAASGKQIMAFIGNQLYEGRTQNNVTNQFKPVN